jgi:3-deoxy-manno-octulosonate cytidylyltransferase (CMP-KDO synthetase)
MILHVVRRSLAARNVTRAIVATDDGRILSAVRAAGFEAVMTGQHHPSGSDRLAEVAAALEDADVIVNVQGDEPLISPQTIERVVDALAPEAVAVLPTTGAKTRDWADVLSPDVVKVLTDRAGRALYFSRSPIPYPREAVRKHGSLEAALRREPSLLRLFRKHTGLYAYRRAFLLEYAGWPHTILETTEALEQLRALERGVTIRVLEATEPSIGVDTMEDLERVRAIIKTGTSGE